MTRGVLFGSSDGAWEERARGGNERVGYTPGGFTHSE